jgi:hypothetical protein
MANASLEVTVKIDPSSVEVVNLIRAANSLLDFRQGIISKEFDKFSPTLCGALHDLSMAVKAAEQCVHTDPPSALVSAADSTNTAGG